MKRISTQMLVMAILALCSFVTVAEVKAFGHRRGGCGYGGYGYGGAYGYGGYGYGSGYTWGGYGWGGSYAAYNFGPIYGSGYGSYYGYSPVYSGNGVIYGPATPIAGATVNDGSLPPGGTANAGVNVGDRTAARSGASGSTLVPRQFNSNPNNDPSGAADRDLPPPAPTIQDRSIPPSNSQPAGDQPAPPAP